MTKKYYWAIVVAAAFVAGTMTTGGIVYATMDQCNNNPPQGISNCKPFLEIWAAICDLENQVDDIEAQDKLLGFYKVRDQQTATEEQVTNGAVSEATCDPSDFPESVGFFGPRGVRVEGMSISESPGGTAGVFLVNLVEGSAFGVGVNCADFAPAHVEDP